MSMLEAACLAALLALVGMIVLVRRSIRIAHRRLEARAGAPAGGMLDATAFAWVLNHERLLAAQVGQRLSLLLVVPGDRRWKASSMASELRRNEFGVLIGDGSAGVLVWHATDDACQHAAQRYARYMVAIDPAASIGCVAADGDEPRKLSELVRAARRVRRPVTELADVDAAA